MAKKAAAEVASLNPAEMLAGGLKTDFKGKITEAVYAPWDYEGKIDNPVLAARLTIVDLDADEDAKDREIVQHWSAGDLASFVPSQDGEDATEGEGMEIEPGPYALRVGKRAQLNNNTNFAQLMESIINAGKASKKFGSDDLTGSLECLEGLVCHWDRVPQPKRAGLVEDSGSERKGGRDVLVVTSIYSYREDEGKSKKGGKADPKSDKAKAKAKEADDDDDDDSGDTLDERLSSVIMEALAEAPGEKLKKGKLAAIVLKAMAQDKEKGKAIKRCTDDEFLNSGSWTYDEETGVLSL